MKKWIYIIATILVFIWAVLVFVFKISGAVHFLLVAAGIILLIKYSFRKGLT
jgi:hypothetical protein